MSKFSRIYLVKISKKRQRKKAARICMRERVTLGEITYMGHFIEIIKNLGCSTRKWRNHLNYLLPVLKSTFSEERN